MNFLMQKRKALANTDRITNMNVRCEWEYNSNVRLLSLKFLVTSGDKVQKLSFKKLGVIMLMRKK